MELRKVIKGEIGLLGASVYEIPQYLYTYISSILLEYSLSIVLLNSIAYLW